jgi:hypothetical protein
MTIAPGCTRSLSLAGLALSFGLAFPVASPPSAEAAQVRFPSAILISWDGTRADVLRELLRWQPIDEMPQQCPSRLFPARMPEACGEYWSCLPRICNFQFVDSHVAEGRTLTRPQHAIMLTGEPSEVTTITRNNGASNMPQGITIYERLAAAFGPHFHFAHVGDMKYTVSGILEWPRREGLLPHGYILGRGGPDRYTGTSSNARLIPKLHEFAPNPFFIFQHQKGPDWSAHVGGDGDISYREAIMEADARLGEVLDELQALGIADSTLVLVTTDHGFNGNVHLGWRKPTVARTWIASSAYNLECFARGSVLDVVPTLLESFGIDLSTINSDLPGRSLLDSETTAPCQPFTCGNGVVEYGEHCDGEDMAGETCTGLGYTGGNLGCHNESCSFDTSDCSQEVDSGTIEINGAGTSNAVIVATIRDPNGSGPDFEIDHEEFRAELRIGDELIWSSTIPGGDKRWRSGRLETTWNSGRVDSPAGGLVNVFMTSAIRRLVATMRAVQTGLGPLEDGTKLHLTYRAGSDRFDHDFDCKVTNEGQSAICKTPSTPD